jgi:hypothetical protein
VFGIFTLLKWLFWLGCNGWVVMVGSLVTGCRPSALPSMTTAWSSSYRCETPLPSPLPPPLSHTPTLHMLNCYFFPVELLFQMTSCLLMALLFSISDLQVADMTPQQAAAEGLGDPREELAMWFGKLLGRRSTAVIILQQQYVVVSVCSFRVPCVVVYGVYLVRPA